MVLVARDSDRCPCPAVYDFTLIGTASNSIGIPVTSLLINIFLYKGESATGLLCPLAVPEKLRNFINKKIKNAEIPAIVYIGLFEISE